MPRITKSPEERRAEILDAAEALFNSKGYDQTAVSDIVKHIGVAQGTFYYYFKSKQEIAEALIERWQEQALQRIRTIAADPQASAIVKLNRMFEAGFLNERKDTGTIEFLHLDSNALLHQKQIVGMIRAVGPMFETIIRQGMQEGVFRVDNPLAVGQFLIIGVHFMFDPGFFRWTEEERSLRMDAMHEVIAKLLGAVPGTLSLSIFA